MMNKTLEFRVWHESAKRFLYFGNPDIEINDGYGMYLVPEEDYSSIDCDGFFQQKRIFQQYVGEEDKHNKKIYDGDIVKIPRNTSTNGVKDYDLAVVKWFWNRWVTEIIHPDPIRRENSFFLYNAESMEIVGNILQNPNLVNYE